MDERLLGGLVASGIVIVGAVILVVTRTGTPAKAPVSAPVILSPSPTASPSILPTFKY